MIEEKAYVVGKSETHAWVEAQRRTGCDGCAVSKQCGTGAIAKYLIRKSILIKALNPIGAEIGDIVVVGIPERTLLLGSFVLYTMPLLVMFLGAGLAEILVQYFDDGESLVILFGFGGLSAGLLWARYVPMGGGGFEPKVLHAVAKAADG